MILFVANKGFLTVVLTIVDKIHLSYSKTVGQTVKTSPTTKSTSGNNRRKNSQPDSPMQ